MKALVTGATGFVGQALCRRLTELDYKVSVFHRKSSDTDPLKLLPLHHHLGDITSPEDVQNACLDCDVVFHLAGLVGYSPSMRDAMQAINVGGTRNIVNACATSPSSPLLIHLSSVTAVGAGFSPDQVLTEESPYNLQHLNLGYFETKREAEHLVQKAVFHNNLKSIILNPSTIYGPGDSKKGSRNVQLKVARGKFPFYPSGGVSIIHIDDVIDCLIKAVQLKCYGERFILSGENLYIKDLFRIIAEEANVTPPQIPLPSLAAHIIGQIGQGLEFLGKKGALNRETAWTSTLFHWFDSTKAQKTFQFTPKTAQEAIRSSIEWSRQQNLI